MKARRSNIEKLGSFFANIAKAVVYGLPKEKFYFKPTNKIIIQNNKETLKPESEKHYHRPMAKPAVEKQTLLKEKKKVKTVH